MAKFNSSPHTNGGRKKEDSSTYSPVTHGTNRGEYYSHCKECGDKMGPYKSEDDAFNGLNEHKAAYGHFTVKKPSYPN